MKKLIYLLMAAVLASGLNAQAEQLAVWNFNDIASTDLGWETTGATNAPTKNAGVDTAVITALTAADTRKSSNAIKIINTTGPDLADSITNDKGFQIKLTPVSGQLITVTQVVVTIYTTSGSVRSHVLIDDENNGFDTGDSISGELDPLVTQLTLPVTQIVNGTSAVLRVYGYGGTDLYLGHAFVGASSTDDVIIYGTLSAATGPADFAYTATANSIKPGEPQDIDVVIRNDGFNATNIVSTLTSANGLFSVLSGAITNAALAGGASITNTFSIQAVSNTTAQAYPTALSLNIAGYGNNGALDTTNASVAVTVQSTITTSMDKTDFAADVTGTDTATLTVSNSAAFGLQFNISNSETWLSAPSGTLNLVAGGTTNITITADANQTPGQGQYTDTLAINWLNNGSLPNPTNFSLQFDVGPKIEPLTADAVIVESGGVNNLGPDIYEPGEILNITITSTNNGAITVSNITNTLTLPTGWGTPSPASAVYPSMAVGDSTSTTYTVTIPAFAADGTYTCTVQNAASGSSWSGTFTLDVYNQANPSVLTNELTINVPAGGTGIGTLTLTNAGNASTTFALSDNGSWDVSYSVQTQTASLVTFSQIFDEPNTNNTFVNWSGNSTVSMPIGFNVELFGQTYTDFSVSRYGALSFGTAVDANTNSPFTLPSGTSPVIAPFWGSTQLDTNSIRYTKQYSDKLVVAWGNRTGAEFQAWIYTNGTIRYLYQQRTWGDGAIGAQNGVDAQNIAYTPGSASESILLTPVNSPWVTYSPIDGDLDGLDSQTITFSADATDQTTGTTFTATITWGDASTDTALITVIVGGGSPGLDAPTDVPFMGPAGFISQTNMTLVNTGDVALVYTITDIGAQAAGYNYTNLVSDWEDPSFTDSDISGVLFEDGGDEDVSELIPIGFNFPFYGAVYSQLSIGVNGAVSLGESELMTTEYSYTDGATWNPQSFFETNTLSTPGPLTNGLPSQSPSEIGLPARLIAPYWENLQADNNARVLYSGNENLFIVKWENMNQTGGGADQTFQAILYKDGTIRFQYDSVSGSNTWPFAEIGLRDGNGARTTPATPAHTGGPYDITAGTMMIVTNLQGYYTNNYDDQIFVVTNTVVSTNYSEVVTGEAIIFTPAAPIIITVEPASGTLPVGGSQVVNIYGDARSLTPGGPNDVFASTTFSVGYTGGSKSVAVMFLATNSADIAFADADEDGMSDLKEMLAGTDKNSAESVFGVNVTQNTDGSRSISWPKPSDSLSRTYTVLYTTNLLDGWLPLAVIQNGNSYTDTDPTHANLPAIYYKVTVE